MNKKRTQEVTYTWNVEVGLFAGYPATTTFLTEGEIKVEPSFTQLPLPNNFNEFRQSIVIGDATMFNGYPVNLHFKNSKTLKANKGQCNFPLQPLFPLSVQAFTVISGYMDGMPITVAHNPYFINDSEVQKYSDTKYLTPLQAKILIQNYIIEQAKKKAVVFSKQVKNSKAIGHNKRVEIYFEDPIDDPNWCGTIALLNESKMPEKENENGTRLICEVGKNFANKYKEEPFMLKDLTNGKKYYIAIATYNKNREIVINAENKFEITPELKYKKTYDSAGRLMDISPIL